MLLRAFALLFVAVVLSWSATMYFGDEVLIAFGLILIQAKVFAKKLVQLELPIFLVWLKAQAGAFLRIELVKKWLMTTIVPLLVGKAVLRRLAAYLSGYRLRVRRRYERVLHWYDSIHPVEKIVAAIILLSATLALSVTSLGLWLIFFSVKLPLWIMAVAAGVLRYVWLSVQKMTFKAVAFFQLSMLWRSLRRLLPARWLERKRRFNFRVARAVVRRRRLTVRQLADRKGSLPFRLGFTADYIFRTDRSG